MSRSLQQDTTTLYLGSSQLARVRDDAGVREMMALCLIRRGRMSRSLQQDTAALHLARSQLTHVRDDKIVNEITRLFV
ncbi:hypothetical protein [Pseudoalteromonas sp. R3]|uniref:hypothetical protein n=1 Tax=Pseudoalteromonas sp. R3 TaxID=1709477 RepID=UPI000AC9542C|nr:hypothetical protein [Pseudoalteromonas sp. R3]